MCINTDNVLCVGEISCNSKHENAINNHPESHQLSNKSVNIQLKCME